MTKKQPPRRRHRPDWQQQWADLKATAIKAAWQWMMKNPGCRCYLYYSPAIGTSWGKFYVVPEMETAQQPQGIVPVSPETIPQGTQAQILVWLNQYAERLPMLGNALD